MRLTLRTLLAYLDNTLEDEDLELLRAKLTESGFASQLVLRIRQMMSNGELSSPSPHSVGPVEDPNVISEYLDSTLTAEQVAEIERACLESDPHLAEAAACHQILTMVLGRKAEVPQALREKIYLLPENNVEQIVAGSGSFAAVNIPPQPELKPLQDNIPEVDETDATTAVSPVGLNDSGVSDAPTRLRQSETGETEQTNEAALAGVRARKLDEASYYGGTVRASRIAPWLVSLALLGVLFFALSRIFAPLMQGRSQVADQINSSDQNNTVQVDDQNGGPDVDTDVERGPDTPPLEKVQIDSTIEEDGSAPPSPTTASDSQQSDVVIEESDDAPPGLVAEEDADVMTEDSDDAPPVPTEVAETDDAPPVPVDVDVSDDAPPVPMDSDASKTGSSVETDSDAPPVPPGTSDSGTGDSGTGDSGTGDSGTGDSGTGDSDAPPVPDGVDATDAPPVPADTEEKPQGIVEVAKVVDGKTLLVGRLADGPWIAMPKDAPVGSGVKLVCGPTFRCQLAVRDKSSVTLVGPTEMSWVRSGEQIELQLQRGRLLISSSQPGTVVRLRLRDYPLELKMEDPNAVVAVSVKYFRQAGFDPTKVENRIRLAGVLCAEGSVTVVSEGDDVNLQAGLQWEKRGDLDPSVVAMDGDVPASVYAWIDPPNDDQMSLESNARDGLLEILPAGKPLELSLQEAMGFRRSEVGALAAQTLLLMGRSDVYFGTDGILSQSTQRNHWQDHFRLLMQTMAQGAGPAQNIIAAAVKMDAGNAMPIRRLLTGYSNQQLVEGGDEELVNLLDSSSMTVRVLAIENLRLITGTTLYFRPEQENSVRRTDSVKKWDARRRKGDIRWPQ